MATSTKIASMARPDMADVFENGDVFGNVLQNDKYVVQVSKVNFASGSFVKVPAGGVTLDFGCTDPEDIKINPLTGNLYVVGELTHSI